MKRTDRTLKELRVLLDVAAGRRPADLYLEGAVLLNVYSGECYPANVAIAGRRVAYTGDGRSMIGPSTRVLALHGKTVAPGYIDPHTHITGMVNPVTFAREVLRTGTTALVADAMQFALHTPPDRIAEILDLLAAMPVRIVWSARLHGASHLPDETMFSFERVKALLDLDAVRVAGEVTRWPAVYHGDEDLLRKLARALAAGRRVEGHAPGASADRLQALAAAGWSGDHEAITPEEVVHRLRAGVYTALRHSSLRPDVPALAAAVTEDRARSGRLLLTADGPEAATIAREGYMDHVVRQAIAGGIPPVAAYQMATVNPATYLGLDEELGGIAPGRRADVLVLDDLRNPTPELVIAAGEVAARDGRSTAVFPEVDWPRYFPPRFRPVWEPSPELFELPAGPAAEAASGGDRVTFPVIRLENSVITRRQDVPMPVRAGRLAPPPGVLHLALLDPAGRWITRGALGNFAERLGGLASTFNVVAHLSVIGQDPRDMARAAARVLALGGGIVAVEDGTPVLELPLPIGGIMSAEPFGAVAEATSRLAAFLRARGYPHADPHYSLLFLPLDSLPDLRVTYRGVWDVRRGRVLIPREDLA